MKPKSVLKEQCITSMDEDDKWQSDILCLFEYDLKTKLLGKYNNSNEEYMVFGNHQTENGNNLQCSNVRYTLQSYIIVLNLLDIKRKSSLKISTDQSWFGKI